MTDILAFLAAHWLLLCIALAALIFLAAGVAWAVSWYFWTWVIEANEPEGMPLEHIAYGDVPHIKIENCAFRKRRAA